MNVHLLLVVYQSEKDYNLSKERACLKAVCGNYTYTKKGNRVVFGYIVGHKGSMSQEELSRYQGYYCGLCKALEKEYGQLERIGLSFDMTFLALFLSSLYEPEEETKACRCIFHPLKEKSVIHTEYLDYAAAMTIALMYHKCLDDWNDERRFVRLKYAQLLKKSYAKVKEKYPRQCTGIEKSLWQLNMIEKDKESTADDAINYGGMLMSELFVYKEDFWSNCLRTFGYELGRFIYLMDATMDYEQDIKKGNYNPLTKMNKKPEEMKELLELAIGSATEQFEKLPIVQDDNLLRNVLYGGVWQKYYEKFHEKEKNHG